MRMRRATTTMRRNSKLTRWLRGSTQMPRLAPIAISKIPATSVRLIKQSVHAVLCRLLLCVAAPDAHVAHSVASVLCISCVGHTKE